MKAEGAQLLHEAAPQLILHDSVLIVSLKGEQNNVARGDALRTPQLRKAKQLSGFSAPPEDGTRRRSQTCECDWTDASNTFLKASVLM